MRAATLTVSCAALLLGAPAAAAAQQAKGTVELAPHRAVYEFTFASARAKSTVAALTGRMVYEFQGSRCDGYTQQMRFVTLSTAASGETTLADQRSTTWEDPTGKQMRFQTSQYRDRKLVEQAAGTARRESDGIKVRITVPDEGKAEIGGAALFPVQHSLKLLEAARGGARSFKSDFYDGAESGTKSYVVTAFMGRRKPPGHNRTLARFVNVQALDGIAAWPVSLGYYEHGSEAQDAVPAYEMSFLFFENGVSRSLTIDNGDYVIKGKLTGLEMLEPMPCRQ